MKPIHEILIVDDEPANLKIMVDYLMDSEFVGTLAIYQALNGETAVKIAETKLPDLILMDWQMPVLDGLQATKKLKQIPATKNIPVIMTTGVMTMVEHLSLAFESGVIDYIRKPIDKLELIARVRSALLLSDSLQELNEKQKIITNLNNVVIESEIKYLQLSTASFEGIFISDYDKIVEVNYRMTELTGYSMSELIEDKFSKIVTENHRRIFYENLDNKTEIRLELIIKRKNGTCFPAELISNQYHHHGKLIRINLLRNLTEQKQKEEELKKQQELIFEKQKEILKIETEKLNNDLDFKRKELATNALYLVNLAENNAILLSELAQLKTYLNPKGIAVLNSIISKHKSIESDELWSKFDLRFDQVHDSFYAKLLQTAPDLSPSELKLCALLRLNLSSKDIAVVTRQNPESINVARSRLRAKLKLLREENIITFLSQI